MKSILTAGALAATSLCLPGCIQVNTHSTIDPIHMTVDVNVNVKVQRELQNVFGDLDAAKKRIAEELETPN